MRIKRELKLSKKLQRRLERLGRRFQAKIISAGISRGLVKLQFFLANLEIDLRELNKKAQTYFARMKTAHTDLKLRYSALQNFLSSVGKPNEIIRLEGENFKKWVSLQKKFHSAEAKYYQYMLKFAEELSKHISKRMEESLFNNTERFLRECEALRALSAVIDDAQAAINHAKKSYFSIKKFL